MTNNPQRISKLVNSYLTPFAFLLVAASGWAAGWNVFTKTAFSLVCFTAIINFGFLYLSGIYPAQIDTIGKVRLAFNYTFNILIVYLLWPIWHPIWILFLLTQIVTAIFNGRKEILVNAALFSFVMLYIQIFNPGSNKADIKEALMYITSFWFFGLFIHQIIHSPRE